MKGGITQRGINSMDTHLLQYAPESKNGERMKGGTQGQKGGDETKERPVVSNILVRPGKKGETRNRFL